MVFTRFIPARGVLLAAAFVFLFQAGCGLFAPRGKTLSVKIAPRVKMRFVYIEPLKIFAGKYEVSNREYRCFRPAHSSGGYEGMSLDGDRQPAVNVSWKDANAFCAWLTKNYGATPAGSFVFRLPTEKEWETYAAGGSGAEFPWGAWPPPKHLNYYGRENKGVAQSLETCDGYRVSCPVHKSCANALGLYGVAGNVWEWCQDKDEPQSAMRVLKGASWADCAPLFLRTGRRSAYEPDYKYINLGFRVVAEPSAPKTPAVETPAPDPGK